MKTIYLKDSECKRLQEISAEAERLPMLQFAYFVGKVKQEFGSKLADEICLAAKGNYKLNIQVDERN